MRIISTACKANPHCNRHAGCCSNAPDDHYIAINYMPKTKKNRKQSSFFFP